MNIENLTNEIVNYPLVYLSGPFRGKNGGQDIRDSEVKKNIEIAASLAKVLWENEIGVLCPHLNTSMEFNDETLKKPDVFLYSDLKMQMACDAIVMLPGWEESEGAKKEKEFAEQIGQPVYVSLVFEGFRWEIGEVDKWERPVADLKDIFDEDLNSYPKQFLSMRLLQAMSYFVHVQKNKDYSPMNILGTGQIGIATRLWDKEARLMNLIGFDIRTGEYTGVKEPKNESIEDTLMDMANYALIGLIYRMGLWGK